MLQTTEYNIRLKLVVKKSTGVSLRLKGHGFRKGGKTVIRPLLRIGIKNQKFLANLNSRA